MLLHCRLAKRQMDVSTFFLHGQFELGIYIIQPTGLADGDNQVCMLQKALNRPKQAPRVLSRKIERLMKKYGYIPFYSDSGVDHRPDREILIAIFVDEVLIVSSSCLEIYRAKCMLKSHFRML